MTISAAYENDKEIIKERLTACNSIEDASAVIQMEMEHITDSLAQNTEDDLARKRYKAIMALCRLAPKLLHGCTAKGELFLDGEKENGLQSFITKMPIAGYLLLIAIAAYEAISGQMIPALLIVVGTLIIAGMKRSENEISHFKAKGIATLDVDHMMSLLGELCQSADTCIEDLDVIEKENRLHNGELSDNALLSLMESLMEAKFAGRADMALHSLEDAEQYLRLMGIEALPYNQSNESFFEILPTIGEERTIRPAFVKDGKLLRRGVAVKHA